MQPSAESSQSCRCPSGREGPTQLTHRLAACRPNVIYDCLTPIGTWVHHRLGGSLSELPSFSTISITVLKLPCDCQKNITTDLKRHTNEQRFCTEIYLFCATQLQDPSSKLLNEIMFHHSSEPFTGCPSKHVSRISCQHSITPFFFCLLYSL